MPSNFPGAIDNFTDPLSNSSLSSPSHAGQHSDLNDAVEKIETYMGLVKVIPTAATNGTINATGTVTIGNAVTTVSVTCFTSQYDNYQIVLSGGVASTNTALSFGFTGTSTGYYGGWTGTRYDTNAVSGLGVNNAASWTYCGFGDANCLEMSIIVINPAVAKRKYCNSTPYIGAGGIYGSFVGETTVNTAQTGFTIGTTGGVTMTGGTIRVYGYRN